MLVDSGGAVAFGEEFSQVLGAEADLIDLVCLGFPEKIENPVDVQFTGLTQPLHLDSLREGRGAVLTLHGFQKITLFLLSQIRKLHGRSYDKMEEETREIYRAGMAAFEGIAPEYHIELRERPTMVWDFHSLLLAIQMMFSFMLVDETATLKLCPNCYKAFFTENEDDVYCSENCEM